MPTYPPHHLSSGDFFFLAAAFAGHLHIVTTAVNSMKYSLAVLSKYCFPDAVNQLWLYTLVLKGPGISWEGVICVSHLGLSTPGSLVLCEQ